MNSLPEPIVPLDADLNSALGLHVDAVEDRLARGHFEIENRVRQPFGIVHGGAYAAIAETLASVGTFHAVAAEGNVAMGMNNDTTFLRAMGEGRIEAVARAIHSGSTTWVWEVEMRDSDARLCAVSRVTIAVRKRRA